MSLLVKAQVKAPSAKFLEKKALDGLICMSGQGRRVDSRLRGNDAVLNSQAFADGGGQTGVCSCSSDCLLGNSKDN